jgi:PAS domain S-box-containing protein
MREIMDDIRTFGDQLPDNPQLTGLIRLFKEAEIALQSVLHEQIDAVIDPETGIPILLEVARNHLLISEDRYRRLLSRNAVIIFELEPDGTVLYANDAVFDVLGYKVQELEGCNWWNIFFPAERQQVDELYRRFQDDDVREYQLTLTTKGGSAVILELTSANRRKSDGTLDRILGLGVDVTERQKAEKELDEHHARQEWVNRQRIDELTKANMTLLRLADLNRQLLSAEQTALAASEQANKIKVQFLAMISHELRTPLTSIKGLATTLLATDVNWDTEDQYSFIGIISEEANKMTELVNQLLDLSQLQTGTLKIQMEQHRVTTIINTAMMQLETVTAQHRFSINVSPDLPPVMADAQRIANVIVNLVGNATKYAPPGTQIILSATQQENTIRVNVSDEGPGIPIENREKIFDIFWQSEKPTAQHSKGAGLGLAICKSIVNAHKGKIWVADTSSGTTISFTVPTAL